MKGMKRLSGLLLTMMLLIAAASTAYGYSERDFSVKLSTSTGKSEMAAGGSIKVSATNNDKGIDWIGRNISWTVRGASGWNHEAEDKIVITAPNEETAILITVAVTYDLGGESYTVTDDLLLYVKLSAQGGQSAVSSETVWNSTLGYQMNYDKSRYTARYDSDTATDTFVPVGKTASEPPAYINIQNQSMPVEDLASGLALQSGAQAELIYFANMPETTAYAVSTTSPWNGKTLYIVCFAIDKGNGESLMIEVCASESSSTEQDDEISAMLDTVKLNGYANFDYIAYADTYADLKRVFGYNKDQLYQHYATSGRAEGRVAKFN